jgi:glutathione synthase
MSLLNRCVCASVDARTHTQIEVNNIASGAAALSQKCTRLHDYVLRKYWRAKGCTNVDVQRMLTEYGRAQNNASLDTIVDGLLAAWCARAHTAHTLYRRAYGDSGALVLMVIEDFTTNIADQRTLEYALQQRSNNEIDMVRLTLTECSHRYAHEHRPPRPNTPHRLLLDASYRLWYKHRPVGVVYFRAGYVPAHFHSDIEWTAREMLEQSYAIKCPWVGLQLVNTKKMQQVSTDKYVGNYWVRTGIMYWRHHRNPPSTHIRRQH